MNNQDIANILFEILNESIDVKDPITSTINASHLYTSVRTVAMMLEKESGSQEPIEKQEGE